MVERIVQFKKPALEHIVRSRKIPLSEVQKLVSELNLLGLNKNQIYARLMEGFGVPKPQIIGAKDGEMKDGGKKSTRNRPAKRHR